MTAMILAGLFSALPSHAFADDTEDVSVKTVYHNGEKFAEISFFPEGKGLGLDKEKDWFVDPSKYTPSVELKKATVSAAEYWADIIGDGAKNKDAWTIYLNTNEEKNAGAASYSIRATGDKNSFLKHEAFIKDQLQDGKELLVIDQDYINQHGTILPAGDYGFSEITVGKYFGAKRTRGAGVADCGWWVDADTVLPTNEQAADYVGTIRHELGHALGISLVKGERTIDSKKYSTIYSQVRSEDSWQLHLMDQTGKMAKPGMIISTSSDIPAGWSEDDVFIVDKATTSDGKGFAYFVGDNVRDALDGATFLGRSALPVNGWEGEGKSKFDGSHLQTAGMMSHRAYSNYTTFLEVELAVMQDLGYDIDRRAHFGRSVYGNGLTINNTNGYFARNSDGTAYLANTYSTVPLGVGLHIYGSNNTVTQSANILTRGTGATGVRVDGMGNTLIIPENTEIHADGYRGNGILVAYGRGQTVNQAGTVTASGQGGTGIRFDFGSSTNGAGDEYRGSYIRYVRSVSGGEITDSPENAKLTDMSVTDYNVAADELNGAMVENYNLSGTLVGGENAIYIAKNAFVKNINVNEGASIRGNITSDWKQFGDDACEGSYDKGNKPLRIQYGENHLGENGYEYSLYIPDLVTHLNFNTGMKYNWFITGKDNMKVFFNNGTSEYGGTADVVTVEVGKNAKLYGGSYILNDMSGKMAQGFSDNSTGWFINHGVIAPISTYDMAIVGKLDSDGAIGIATYNNGQQASKIVVEKNAKITDTELVNIEGQSYLPGQEYTFLSVKGNITGELDTHPGDYFSGFLNVGATNGKTTASLVRADNIGAMDGNQQAIYNSLDMIYNNTDAAGKGRVGKVYSLGTASAKEALTDMSSGTAMSAGLVMRQNTVMNALTARHRYLTHQANVPVNVPLSSFVNNYTATAPKPSASSADPGLSLIVPVELSEGGGLWFKFAKGWGSYGGDVSGHGFTASVGADYVASPKWKLGALYSFSKQSYGGQGDHRDTKDHRFGLYGDWRVGPHSAFLYVGAGWQNHDQKRHFYAGDNYNAKADYSGKTIEFNGRYSYDLDYGKQGWHNKPFASFQAVHYRQGAYSETGAYEFGQVVDSGSSTYTAAAIGWDFARDFGKDGYVEVELGVSRTLGGANPCYGARLAGGGEKFSMRSRSMDKTRVLLGIYGSRAISDRWRVGGELGVAQGPHDRDITASVSLRLSW
ncbi:hypothetical protein SAMN02745190_01795 [Schwartzia succinivorans DSM 10502]|jgi:hypothetical protein|uniref:Autotransporter domain-containing protein n=2 Tax=Schwartzia TaxID=55506 RepID=A0A1M4YLH5_9FIRM|nr:hypothetical protein SAMN02745190_01795 [Schwartzia succinivorans DSM 10502]